MAAALAIPLGDRPVLLLLSSLLVVLGVQWFAIGLLAQKNRDPRCKRKP